MATYHHERPKEIIAVMDKFMDLKNYPAVKKSWDLRILGTKPIRDKARWAVIVELLKMELPEIKSREKVYKPLNTVMRKIILDHAKYGNELWTKKEKYYMKYDNIEVLRGIIDKMIMLYIQKRTDYQNTRKENRKEDLRKEIMEQMNNEEDDDDSSSSGDGSDSSSSDDDSDSSASEEDSDSDNDNEESPDDNHNHKEVCLRFCVAKR